MKVTIRCYCFNEACESSVYADTGIPVSVPLAVVLSRTLFCSSCGQVLVSPLLIDIRRDVFALLERTGRSSLVIIDDDPLYHETIRRLLPDSRIPVFHYLHAPDAMEWLLHAFHNNTWSHTVLFLDLHMPLFDGWHFLNELAATDPKLQRLITVYIVSDSVDPDDERRANRYPFVRSLISKPLTHHFCERIREAIRAYS
ncbi:MAG TPA: response regulator [Chitinophagaceae bacterium]